MELNSFLFPAPQSSYSIHGSIGDIIYIPRKFERKDHTQEHEVINELFSKLSPHSERPPSKEDGLDEKKDLLRPPKTFKEGPSKSFNMAPGEALS